jgi:hypothetical protein
VDPRSSTIRKVAVALKIDPAPLLAMAIGYGDEMPSPNGTPSDRG